MVETVPNALKNFQLNISKNSTTISKYIQKAMNRKISLYANPLNIENSVTGDSAIINDSEICNSAGINEYLKCKTPKMKVNHKLNLPSNDKESSSEIKNFTISGVTFI